MKPEKIVKNKKRLHDLYHKTKKVGSYGCGHPKSHPRTVDGLYDTVQANPSLMNRVKEVQDYLDPKFAIFIKSMNRSAVTVGFMLTLSRPFADLHMPGHDASVVLVDAGDREEYRINYLAERCMFSGGWNAFSIARRLLEGDVLIFQLIKPCEFKVYVVRKRELDEVDGAVALVRLKGDGRQRNSGNSTNTFETYHDNGRHLEYLPQDSIQENSKTDVGLLLEGNSSNTSTNYHDNGRHLTYLPKDSIQENSKTDVGLLLEEIITETTNTANAANAINLQLASCIDSKSHFENSEASEQLQASVRSTATQMDRLDALALKAKDKVESAKERERNSCHVYLGEQKEKEVIVEKLLRLIEAKVRLGGEIEIMKSYTSRLRLEFRCQKEAESWCS